MIFSVYVYVYCLTPKSTWYNRTTKLQNKHFKTLSASCYIAESLPSQSQSLPLAAVA